MTKADPVISVANLSKTYRVHERAPGLYAAFRSLWHRSYKSVHAVSDLSFTIEPGERVGFLGPNGAGKTTTLKMLSGLLHPTSGTIRVAGHEPRRRHPDFLSRITLVMGQKQQLLWDLPPSETFALNRAIFGISESDFKKTMGELEDLLHLSEVSSKPTRQLSLGERMKCELAAALLHRPAVLFLDEPTIGLDVSMQLTVREFIRHYNEKTGATLLLTSHYMDDVVSLCPRIIVIDKGKLLYDGELSALVRSLRPEKRIVLRLSAPLPRNTLEQMGRIIELDDSKAILQVSTENLRASVSHCLGQPDVSDLTVEDPPLEEVMRELFSKTKDDTPNSKQLNVTTSEPET